MEKLQTEKEICMSCIYIEVCDRVIEIYIDVIKDMYDKHSQ